MRSPSSPALASTRPRHQYPRGCGDEDRTAYRSAGAVHLVHFLACQLSVVLASLNATLRPGVTYVAGGSQRSVDCRSRKQRSRGEPKWQAWLWLGHGRRRVGVISYQPGLQQLRLQRCIELCNDCVLGCLVSWSGAGFQHCAHSSAPTRLCLLSSPKALSLEEGLSALSPAGCPTPLSSQRCIIVVMIVAMHRIVYTLSDYNGMASTLDRKLFVGGLDWSTTQGKFHHLTLPALLFHVRRCRDWFFFLCSLQVVCLFDFFSLNKLQTHLCLWRVTEPSWMRQVHHRICVCCVKIATNGGVNYKAWDYSVNSLLPLIRHRRFVIFWYKGHSSLKW